MPEMRTGPGAWTKLTEDTAVKIVRLISSGNRGEVAAEASGISKPTYYRWMKLAREYKYHIMRDQPPPDELEQEVQNLSLEVNLIAFYESVQRARAESQARHVAIISLAGEKDWRASAFLLERQYPNEWGVKNAVKLSGDPKNPVLVADGTPARDLLMQKLGAIRDRQNENERLGAGTGTEIVISPEQ